MIGGKTLLSAGDTLQPVWACCLRHVVDHWHGRLSLARSFWFDLVLLSLLAWQAAALVRRLVVANSWPVLALALLGFALFWLLVYPWQLVGVVRAARRNLSGNVMLAPVAPLAAVLMSAVAVPQAVELLSVAQALRDGDADDAAPRVAASRPYSLQRVAGTTLVSLRGSLDFGVTAALRVLLADNPGVTGIVLDSDGGPVYEARGVARLIVERRLDTYSLTGCNSACTTAFVAGSRRLLAPAARLGFHSYAISGHSTLFIDIEQEQRTDLAFHASRGVAPEFLEALFDKPHDDIWFPSRETLVAAGVVHGTMDTDSVTRLQAVRR